VDRDEQTHDAGRSRYTSKMRSRTASQP
jgi:hypothetical protein